jgi:hypothetical protein
MAKEFGTDYDTSKMEGFDNPEPGKYHFEVTRVDEDAISKRSGKAQMEVDMEVLAGTTPDQEAKSHREFFSWTADAEKRALQFAVAVGLTTVEELEAKKQAGVNPVIDFNQAVGRQFLGELREEEYEGRTSIKLGFRMWHLDSPKHRDIPRNNGKINQLGDVEADPFVSGGTTSTSGVAGNTIEPEGDLF